MNKLAWKEESEKFDPYFAVFNCHVNGALGKASDAFKIKFPGQFDTEIQPYIDKGVMSIFDESPNEYLTYFVNAITNTVNETSMDMDNFASLKKNAWQEDHPGLVEPKPTPELTDYSHKYYDKYFFNTYASDDDVYEVYFADQYIELIMEENIVNQYHYPNVGGSAPILGEMDDDESGVYNEGTYLEFYDKGQVLTELHFDGMRQTSALKKAWKKPTTNPKRKRGPAYPAAHAIAKEISKAFSVILEAWKYEGEENPEGHVNHIDPMTAGYRVSVSWPDIEGTETEETLGDSMETGDALEYIQGLLDERGYGDKGIYARTGSGGSRMFVMVPYNIDSTTASLKFSWQEQPEAVEAIKFIPNVRPGGVGGIDVGTKGVVREYTNDSVVILWDDGWTKRISKEDFTNCVMPITMSESALRKLFSWEQQREHITFQQGYGWDEAFRRMDGYDETILSEGGDYGTGESLFIGNGRKIRTTDDGDGEFEVIEGIGFTIDEIEDMESKIGSLNKRAWKQSPNLWDVTARSFTAMERHPIPIDDGVEGKSGKYTITERINIDTNDLFNGQKFTGGRAETAQHIKDIYEAFWNTPGAREVVKVTKVVPVNPRKAMLKKQAGTWTGVLKYDGENSEEIDVIANNKEQAAAKIKEIANRDYRKGWKLGKVWQSALGDSRHAQSSLKFSWQSTEVHQDLMDESYDLWQSEEGKNWNHKDFLDNLPSVVHKYAVILGNLNQQVENGGFEQWYGNNYGERDDEILVKEILPQIGTQNAAKVSDLIEIAMSIRADELRGTTEYEDEEFENVWENHGDIDGIYYGINEEFLKEVNEYLFNLKNKAIAKKAQEEDYDYYNDNYRFNEDEEHYCEQCSAPGAKFYNAFGQQLQIGGFDSDATLCDKCHEERFQKEGSKMKKLLNKKAELSEDEFDALYKSIYDRVEALGEKHGIDTTEFLGEFEYGFDDTAYMNATDEDLLKDLIEVNKQNDEYWAAHPEIAKHRLKKSNLNKEHKMKTKADMLIDEQGNLEEDGEPAMGAPDHIEENEPTGVASEEGMTKDLPVDITERPEVPRHKSSPDDVDDGFLDWFHENKESELLWEEYNEYVHYAGQESMRDAMSFNIWMRDKYDSINEASKQTSLKKESAMKQSNGIANNLLMDIFEDKFPLNATPRELMPIRHKAKNALMAISKEITLAGLEQTPSDFPVEWFYKSSSENRELDHNNLVTEVRAQLQDIVNYANSITGDNFYAGMKCTLRKISRDGQIGVKVLREVIDGKINRYGFANEDGEFVVLPNHRETRKNAKIQRPDTGENLTVIEYENFSLESTATLIDELVKRNTSKPEIVKEAKSKYSFEETDAEIGSPEWVDVMLESASQLDWDMAKRKDSSTVNVTDILLDAAREQGVKATANDALNWYDRYYASPLWDRYTAKQYNRFLIKRAVDISDEIPPMGWDASDQGQPAGSGAPKPQLDSLQDENEVGQPGQTEKPNVLYDSEQDTGPQYQVTMNPKTKEVAIKFMDSPEQEKLEQNLQPQAPALQNLPTLNTTPPPAANTEEPGAFDDQEVPVAY